MFEKGVPYSLPKNITVKDARQYYLNYKLILEQRIEVCDKKIKELEDRKEKEVINAT